MKIETITAKNFKRFTDLTIDFSESKTIPKLVLLIGANGSGKSSLFDAFEQISSKARGEGFGGNISSPYFRKYPTIHPELRAKFTDGFVVDLLDHSQSTRELLFYGRSSNRTEPQLKVRSTKHEIVEDSDRPRRYIDKDERFLNDIDYLTQRIMKEVFLGENFDAKELRKKFIDPINAALDRIFSCSNEIAFRLLTLMPSLEGNPPNIQFSKGDSVIHYDLLSSGEKEIINILLNLFARKNVFPNAIYFIDELDVHLHTKLQFALLKELVENWIPDDSQLWTASHSLGFIEYARLSENAAIIDFDELNFDGPITLTPVPKTDLSIFNIAVPPDAALKIFPNRTIIFCENQNDALLNGMGDPKFLFVGQPDKNAVTTLLSSESEFHGLIDRDYLGSTEVDELKKLHKRLHILDFYCIENYMYHPDNFAELAPAGFDGGDYRKEICVEKNRQRDDILLKLRGSRQSYHVLKALSGKGKADAETEIPKRLESDNFEEFYPYFDMKSRMPGGSRGKFNLNPRDLASTQWFVNQMKLLLQL